MSSVKKVAQASASGSLGSAVLEQLLSAGFEVRVLSRIKGKIPASAEGKVEEVVVDYADPASLKSALTGIDAVVSTLGAPAVGEAQRNLVDAAIAAGVQRFIPSNYGCDQENPLTRKLPVFTEKVKTEDYLIEKSKTTPLTYTFVYNNLFLDWGLANGSLLNLQTKTVTLFNGGQLPISVTRMSTTGQAVVGVLKNLEKTKNRSVRVEDAKLTFEQLAEWAEASVPVPWNILKAANTDELKERSDEALKKGILDGWVWMNYIHVGGTDERYGPSLKNLDNELLGIKGLPGHQLEAYVKQFIQQNV